MMQSRRLLAGVTLCLVGLCAHGMDRTEAEDLFAQANDVFARANDLAAADTSAAGDLYLRSAMLYQRLAEDIPSGALQYNLGNAHYRAGDIGRAILAYKRALLYLPTDANLRNNLAQARSDRVDRIEGDTRTTFAAILLFWHHDLSAMTRATVFALVLAVSCTAAGGFLFLRRRLLIRFAAIAGCVALALLASLAAESLTARSRPQGVILAEEIAGRTGDGEIYETSFPGPLHAGTEFVRRDERGGWYHIEIEDGRTCWIPSRAAEMVGGGG